jgi:hypothetical protein
LARRLHAACGGPEEGSRSRRPLRTFRIRAPTEQVRPRLPSIWPASRSPWCTRRKLQQAGEWGTELELLDSACFYLTFFFSLSPSSRSRWNLLLL